MSHLVMRDARVYLAGFDLSGHSNQASLQYTAEVVDDTTFASGGAQRKKAGLLNTVATVQGFVDLDEAGADEAIFGKIGLVDDVMTLAPIDGEGQVAYSFLANTANYNPGAQVGQMFAFTVTGEGTGRLIRGTVMHQATQTASGNGTARQLGQVAAGKKLYAALHVLAVSGTSPTLTVTVESDDAQGMVSPTPRIAFDPMTARGAQIKSVDGPITDTWYRVSFTIGGTTPSFTFVVVVGQA